MKWVELPGEWWRFEDRFQSPRGDFGFLKVEREVFDSYDVANEFQSPRGDFGFLKAQTALCASLIVSRWVSIPSRGFWFFEGALFETNPARAVLHVSIPSRGFWFFEVPIITSRCGGHGPHQVSIPSRGFWFFEGVLDVWIQPIQPPFTFQSPRGDFGFLKRRQLFKPKQCWCAKFQSPRGDFGFLKAYLPSTTENKAY